MTERCHQARKSIDIDLSLPKEMESGINFSLQDRMPLDHWLNDEEIEDRMWLLLSYWKNWIVRVSISRFGMGIENAFSPLEHIVTYIELQVLSK